MIAPVAESNKSIRHGLPSPLGLIFTIAGPWQDDGLMVVAAKVGIGNTETVKACVDLPGSGQLLSVNVT